MTDHPAPPALAGSVYTFTLANGLRVYLREDNRAPLVSVQLWYHVGSSYEPEGHTGLSHALEHLLFEGSSKLAPGQYSALMSRLGGDPNAFTYPDATVFPLTLPRNRLEIALEALADVMASATLSDMPFARELAVVMAERREDIDNSPLALAVEHHQLLVYGNSGYGNPVTGHKTDLDHMTPTAARTWYQTWYHPNNATLAVAGDIALAQLQSWLHGTLQRSPPTACQHGKTHNAFWAGSAQPDPALAWPEHRRAHQLQPSQPMHRPLWLTSLRTAPAAGHSC